MGIDIDITSVSSGNATVLIGACFAIVLFLIIYEAFFTKKGMGTSASPLSEILEQQENQEFIVCKMIAEFAATLAACGATSMQVLSSVAYLSTHFGIHAEVTGLPQHILLCAVDDKRQKTYTINQKIKENPLDFDRIIMLNHLAKETVAENYSPEIFYEKFQKILAVKRLHPNLVLVLASLANASFCRLFNGDFISMAIVATATACGFYLRRTLCSRFKLDFRMGTILAAVVSTVIGTSGYVFQIGETPNVALATSILYLVPGIPYINSLSNLLNGMFLGCISQFFKGAILTICLSLGFCIGLVLTNLHFF
ncbi:threonine/serine exporter ThrE family protein [Fibrobacter sp. HC4]|uniref:threonine/serine ThrE exporter family protein n=1 Tax=Fibrobacter sp. HC4 TaxID=3239812 RepID=UPI0020184BFE|nr:threonine/serine exporter family protein [Fibrobacter succinogenes]MCL4103177.1 Inner membrane protein YjjP [Fibrobacter succinogenes]